MGDILFSFQRDFKGRNVEAFCHLKFELLKQLD